MSCRDHSTTQFPLTPRSEAAFVPLGEGGVVFVPGTSRLFFLNATTAVLWCLLGEDASSADLEQQLTERFAIDRATARRDVETALALFEREGLLVGQEPQPSPPVVGMPRIPAPGALLPEPLAPLSWADFELAGLTVSIALGPANPGRAFAVALAHQRIPAPPHGVQAQARLAALAADGEPGVWDVYLNEALRWGGVAREAVLPAFYSLLFLSACEALAHRLLLHAAVLSRGSRALLLAGETGSGKSTLAAALAASGWICFSDELAVVDVEFHWVTPFTMPFSIKPGSTQVLLPYYPSLATAKFSARGDGKRVHYLPPPATSVPSPGASAEVGTVVFPKYSADAPFAFSELTKPAALARLAETGSSDRALTTADVETLVALVDRNPCYELCYSFLDDAMRCIEDLPL